MNGSYHIKFNLIEYLSELDAISEAKNKSFKENHITKSNKNQLN